MIVVSAVGLAVVAGAILLLVDFDNFIDLRVYRAGGRAWLDGFSLYADEFGRRYGTGLPFTYPPVSAMLFVAIAAVPEAAAVTVITVLSLLALAGVAMMTVKRQWVIAVVAGGVLLEPVRLTLSFGQVNLVLMVLVAADCLLPRTWWPRGTLIGIAAAVKLTPIAILLFFVAHRQWRPVFVAVGAFAGVSLVAWALAPDETSAYLSTVLGNAARIGDLTYTGNQSLNGFWHRLGLGDTLTTALWLGSALGVAAIAWFTVRRARAQGDDLAALLAAATAGLLASPVSWSHHWVWAVLAGVWLAPRLRDWRWPARIATAVGLLLFVAPPHWVLPNRYDRELDWSWWQHVVGNEFTWCGLAFLVVLAVTSSRGPRREAPSSRRRTAAGDLEPEPR
jgi:alpha-1,2-mannosyltransferase